MKYLILLSLLTGCAAPAFIAGVGVASVGVNETTGKTITDHTLSTVENKDCRLSRMLKNEKTCQDFVVVPPEPSESDKMEAVFASRRVYR